jgi:5-methylcytosine-specific restriction enzyme A
METGGSMKRQEFSAKIKVAAFERAKGHCQECTRKLSPGDIHYDHIIPCASGGDASLNNCAVLCRSCHAWKTTDRDIPAIAKGKRVRLRHIGARRMGSFRGWRKMNGQVVYANRADD